MSELRPGWHRKEDERLDDSIEAFFYVVVPFGVIVLAIALLGFPIGWFL
ncbi:hypothetical protein [Corynebacterium callunae]|nr:hypothetical protein [Corynebacterium callunae]MCK2200210.1 hypothetical protein [Corynebacterium callunae]